MREIVLDTETTGLDPFQGTGWSRSAASSWSTASRPARRSTSTSIPNATCRPRRSRCTASRVEFLKDKPLFADIADELIAFIGDAPLVAHNAMFDLGFLNAELERAGKARGGARAAGRHADAGAAQASRRLEPARRSLRALRDRQFTPHQARRAARRRAPGRGLCRADRRPAGAARSWSRPAAARRSARARRSSIRARPQPLAPRLTDDELEAHRAFVATLGDKRDLARLSLTGAG